MLLTDRRVLLAALSAGFLTAGRPSAAAQTAKPAVRLGRPRPFSFQALVARAKKEATQPYKAPPQRAAEIIKGIDFDAAQKIRFRADHALWRGGPAPTRCPSSISADIPPIRWCFMRWKTARAREILYGPDYFDYGASGTRPQDAGQSGILPVSG